MKTKMISTVSVGLLLATSLFTSASAEEGIVRVVTGAKVEVKRNATSSDEKSNNNEHSTSTKVEGDENNGNDGNDNESNDTNSTSSVEKSDNGEMNSSLHRSAVASFVQSLHKIAEREGGIGGKVREIARAQNDSLATTTDAMDKVEARGAFRTFLFGADYTNLGIIKTELASTTSNISQLTTLLNQTMSTSSRTELTAQIQVLQNEQLKLSAYITAHEDIFSLFGWFNK